jgi:transcriptional regulator of heat shock response
MVSLELSRKQELCKPPKILNILSTLRAKKKKKINQQAIKLAFETIKKMVHFCSNKWKGFNLNQASTEITNKHTKATFARLNKNLKEIKIT